MWWKILDIFWSHEGLDKKFTALFFLTLSTNGNQLTEFIYVEISVISDMCEKLLLVFSRMEFDKNPQFQQTQDKHIPGSSENKVANTLATYFITLTIQTNHLLKKIKVILN